MTGVKTIPNALAPLTRWVVNSLGRFQRARTGIFELHHITQLQPTIPFNQAS